MTAGLDLATQINDVATRRLELMRQLGRCADRFEREAIAREISELETESDRLQTERRRVNAERSAAAEPPRPIIPKEKTMTAPTFELYESVARNSVQAEPQPAVSLTTTQISFNQLALDAMGVKVGDRLALYFSRDAGLIAIAKPDPKWSTARSTKLGGVKGGAAGALPGLATFLKWAGIYPKRAKGIYPLDYDGEREHWTFKLPAGSWMKPTAGTPLGHAGSATRGNGVTSADKRGDLPATSPHRRAAS